MAGAEERLVVVKEEEEAEEEEAEDEDALFEAVRKTEAAPIQRWARRAV